MRTAWLHFLSKSIFLHLFKKTSLYYDERQCSDLLLLAVHIRLSIPLWSRFTVSRSKMIMNHSSLLKEPKYTNSKHFSFQTNLGVLERHSLKFINHSTPFLFRKFIIKHSEMLKNKTRSLESQSYF